jgi:DnaJ-domain-containing protein 1
MDEKSKQIFLGLYQMLLSDTEVHPKELEVLYQIGKEKGGFSQEEIQNAVFSANHFITKESLTDDERISDFLLKQAEENKKFEEVLQTIKN